jgi:hypothetical protein
LPSKLDHGLAAHPPPRSLLLVSCLSIAYINKLLDTVLSIVYISKCKL